MQGELDREEEVVVGDGVPCPPTEEASELAGGAQSSPVAKGRASRRRRKRKRVRHEEEEDEEPEMVHEPDLEDDCAVYGDEDCDAIDDAVGGGDNDVVDDAVDGGDNDDNGGLAVEENVNMEEDFPEALRGDEGGTDSDSGDDIWEDEKIPDPLSSDDEDEDRAEEEGNQSEEEDPEVLLALAKTFNTPDDFKLALLRYSLKTRYDIKLYRSEALIVAAKCCYVGDDGIPCGWRVYCSYEKRKHKMQIRAYDSEHICVRSGYSKMLKRSSIALLFEERLRCAKAKTKVLRARHASHDDHFSRIWDYQAEVLKQNPGTEFEIETVPGPVIGSKQRFYRLYICFNSQKDSWKQTCRPVIGIDRAYLKWDIKGHLLAAVGRDGDNRIVPIAWAVVEIENDDNWDWFMRHLSASLGLCEMQHLAIISDKQSSLFKAIHTILPEAEHRQCSKHIMDNWKRDSHDIELTRLFWKISRSYTIEEFNNHMEELRKYNPQAHASLQLTSPMTWSRAFFRIGTCCNDNLNNLSESFNRTIRQARRKPLLEDIRRQCMVRTAKRKWQMVGIPCIHAASVIIGKREKVEDYVSEYYTKAPEVLATFPSQAHPGSQGQVQGSQGTHTALGSQQGSQPHFASQGLQATSGHQSHDAQAHQTHGAESQGQPEGQGLSRFASWFQCSN
ncbi:unnamed protein product [Arabidopsis arenosa]|uniref:MULE transposase domain-containing protein n=1 Tax=Arabidopsis arenosa TaxID=38785 RepID=A0A8S2A0K9_ARAAE|nr:unnamed protein product [Arabidopsis arenosa]